MYFEPPQLAYWDSAKNNWRLDAFTDSQYNEGILLNTQHICVRQPSGQFQNTNHYALIVIGLQSNYYWKVSPPANLVLDYDYNYLKQPLAVV